MQSQSESALLLCVLSFRRTFTICYLLLAGKTKKSAIEDELAVGASEVLLPVATAE